jgi:hypothetical protein
MKGHYKNKPVLKKDHNSNDFNRYVTKMNIFTSRERRANPNKMINKGRGRIGRHI